MKIRTVIIWLLNLLGLELLSQSISIFILQTINENNIHVIKNFNHRMIHFKSHGGCKRYLSFCEIFITTKCGKIFSDGNKLLGTYCSLCNWFMLYCPFYFQRNFATFIILVVFIEVWQNKFMISSIKQFKWYLYSTKYQPEILNKLCDERILYRI